MKALVYNGPRDVRVADVDDARIEAPTDVLVRITATNICGSDQEVAQEFAPARAAARPGRSTAPGNAVDAATVTATAAPVEINRCTFRRPRRRAAAALQFRRTRVHSR
jgi:threonine dehydrogenase-like Zn-dependent dehydrogenase